MVVERCATCGFDGSAWTDDEAIARIAELPELWRTAVRGLDSAATSARPIPDWWSIGEYVNHVREVLFGMRFMLDLAVSSPGLDLGEPPPNTFADEPPAIDIDRALDGLAAEAEQLHAQLVELPTEAWNSAVVLDGQECDAHWICRHAVHDATHHLGDVAALKSALGV